MKAFMDQDFLLNTETARVLYDEAAKDCPIIDYHCHLSPREIYEDIRYDNITQVWLGGDHYKWRLMRSAGVPEKYITGDASDYEKFEKYAEVIGKAIGCHTLGGFCAGIENYTRYLSNLTKPRQLPVMSY